MGRGQGERENGGQRTEIGRLFGGLVREGK